MADLFGGCGYWNDGSFTTKKEEEGLTDDLDLVLICFQISVWSGMSSEQTSIEEGCEYMKRRRIVPGVMLKPFLDFRVRARTLCEEMGEPYLNGYVMRKQDASIAERALGVWRQEFCRKRDEVFAPAYEGLLSDRLQGITPPGCSKEVIFPPTYYVLRRIRFEFDAFALAGHGLSGRNSKEAFLDGLAVRFADELDLICEALRYSNVTEATVCRVKALKERIDSWASSQERFAGAIDFIAQAIEEGNRPHVWCRDKKVFMSSLEAARGALSQPGAKAEHTSLEPPAACSGVPDKGPSTVSAQKGAAGMLARGRSLFPF